ncbi:unnamed protein product [Didymodactylos carnosus]|uniref:Uncharacterized protein n=1 Tax=Didymodactylos carnosus TaxID=1234261 RepID=A0A8S2HED4_9BILA|nr:unnamed protein product [Didymodactylos carnosus]CAF3636668.1 unnamed protein product [Didymodactylos carnosus]
MFRPTLVTNYNFHNSQMVKLIPNPIKNPQLSLRQLHPRPEFFLASKDTLAQMIVDFRLFCPTPICQNDMVQTVTTQIFSVIQCDEILFLTCFGLTTSSGGSGASSNSNSTAPQTSPASTASIQLQQLRSTPSKGEVDSFTQGVSNTLSFSSETISMTEERSGGPPTPKQSATRSPSVTATLFSVLISTIMPTTNETRQRQPPSFSSEKTSAFTKESPQTQKTETNTRKRLQARDISDQKPAELRAKH